MQTYRVNYPLLIGLAVGTLISSGAVYGLWLFQIERKSGWLIEEAEKASNDGDLRRAAEFYGQYLTIRRDDEVNLKYAQTFAELTKLDDITPQEFHAAWQALESIVRDPKLGSQPEAYGIRRQLAKMYALMRRFPDALDHLDFLLEHQAEDEELHVLKAAYLAGSGKYDESMRYYYKLLGYDPVSETFDTEKAVAPHNVQMYIDLARLARSRQEDLELANEVMDQLIAVNPESAEAYLARGQYRNSTDNPDAARQDIEKAYELDPENADMIVAMAIQTAQAIATDEESGVKPENKDYSEAQKYVEIGKKLFPEDYRFYQVAADIEIKRRSYENALAQIDEGLKAIGTQKASLLLLFKADLQLQENDLQGANQTIDDMRREKFRPEFVDYYAARVLLAEQAWFEAKEALSRLRPRVAEIQTPGPLNLRDIDFFLGLCYERLGQLAEALDQYQLVLDADPENESAVAGKKRVSQRLDPRSTEADPLQIAIQEELKKPKDQQDWSKIDAMVNEQFEERKLDEGALLTYKVHLLTMRQEYDQARRALAQANTATPDNLMVHRMAVQLARLDPEVGPEKALATWQKVAQQFGDVPTLRLDKADILIAMKRDNDLAALRAELAALAENIDQWTVPQKVELWSGLAARFLNLGMTDEARQYWTLSAEQQPHELPLRLQLFQLALLENDDAGMQEAQKKILEIVKDRQDSTWLYTEARRKLQLLKRGELGQEAVPDIRLLIDRALEQRRDWHELYILDAELELVTGNPVRALRSFDEAAKRGLPNQLALATHIELLARASRFNDAATQLERLPETSRQSLLGPFYTEILFRTNQVESALEQARLATENNPENPQHHYWYSQLLARSAMVPETSEPQRKAAIGKAIQAMQRVVELQPELADAWFYLINYYASQKNMDLAQQTLRDAQLALSGDNLQIFLAKSYEALGRWFDAETMYRTYYEGAPESEELARAHRLAEFYLGQGYQQPDRVVKATPLINKLLRAGTAGELDSSNASLQWARRMAAKIFAASGSYQNLLKAEKLLSANSQDGELLHQDKLEMAYILAPRPEPASRRRAITLLEEANRIQRLDEKSSLILANLYHATGNWTEYERQMGETSARFPDSPAIREAYARRLIARGDPASIQKAEDHVKKLRQLTPRSTATFDLTVRMAGKLGMQRQARELLLREQPKLEGLTELTQAQERAATLFARLFVELDDLDSAEQMYRNLAAIDPKKSYDLAMFLGLHRGVDQCFAQLEQLYDADRLPEILVVALEVVRQKRDEIGDKYDGQLESWLDRGLLENPESIALLMLHADYLDILKRYDEAADIYRKLLARRDLVDVRRAIVLNNLAFLAALAGPSAAGGDDPLKLVNDAAAILGPSSDILDTRAVVLISQGQFSRAITDLSDAVTDNPTPSKYFHLAQAYLGANERNLAVQAWKRAEELGLNRETINRMEHDKYEEIKRTIEQLPGGAAVTQSERLRPAG